MLDDPKIFPLGDGALTVDFGNTISVEHNDRAIALASYFSRNPFTGFIEAVPAYSSVSIFYDLVEVRRNFSEFETAFDAVREIVNASLDRVGSEIGIVSRTVEIPVDFGPDAALDLDHIATHGGLTVEETLRIFTSETYRVYMLGFLPGFAYMGEVDQRIAVPRRESPRLKVPRGSVGIAGRQTGIYPLESPGGWQIIGRTTVEMFTPNAETPSPLAPGDNVRFVPVK
jgi:inhibitor of KinA